ncbi:cell division protein ZapA [Terasakiella pusilla]|jgi:cell division protein ZapA|uniref:cell division protein ZapA n=1 Tax=Terasakiella pusilla TaxID=64973 RepID=UPI0006924AB7|nr:cell division protein ZapA [Terasakiella pusilla]
MASVSVTINGRRYEIACDEGQEAQLSRLGRYVDDRVRQLAAAVGQLGDTRLMVMTSLLLADELSEKNDELEAYKVEHNATVREKKDQMLADNLDRLAQRINLIADALEPAVEDEKPVEETDPTQEET